MCHAKEGLYRCDDEAQEKLACDAPEQSFRLCSEFYIYDLGIKSSTTNTSCTYMMQRTRFVGH